MILEHRRSQPLKKREQRKNEQSFLKGIFGIKLALEKTREKIVDILVDYEKTSNQIDSIGDELKQIGNSFANVGRFIAGQGTKEVSDEKLGVGLTRIMNTPIKKSIATYRN